MPEEVEVIEEESIDLELIVKRHKKLIRKVIFAIIGLFLVIYLPNFFPKYNDFDVILNAIFFQIILYAILIYTLYVTLRFVRLPQTITSRFVSRFKRHYDFFDLSSFMVYLMTLLVLLNAFVLSFTNVKGSSMEPTLFNEDDLIVLHVGTDYERFDIVIVKIDEGEYFIKRIIGLPGDEVRYEGNTLYINDTVIEEIHNLGIGLTCENVCTYQVPEEHYFILGDNRRNSKDSRDSDVGYIHIDDLFGRAIFRLRPFERIGKVD